MYNDNNNNGPETTSALLMFMLISIAMMFGLTAHYSTSLAAPGSYLEPGPEEIRQLNVATANLEPTLSSTPEQIFVANRTTDYIDIIKEATKLTILEELVISDLPRTYARSCSSREFGCEAHISAMVDLFFLEYQKTGIDPLIIAAMAKHETNFNPFAVNDRTQAAGILQLLPSQRSAEGLNFIHSASYRNQCEGEYYACQEEVLDASLKLLERSIRRCDNSLAQGLGMYGSGSCEGSKRFSRYVLRMSERFRQRREQYIFQLSDRYNHNICNVVNNNI